MLELAAEKTAATAYPGAPDLRALVSSSGEPWLAYRKSLRPRFGVVWRDIALCYAMFLGGLGAAAALGVWLGLPLALAAAPPLGVWIGFWLHALLCFGHEAAHGNLATRRSLNDLLANGLVLVWFALDIRAYRRIHWEHHRHLGDVGDTEVSYHQHLSRGLVLRLFTGLYLLQTLVRYDRSLGRKEAPAGEADRGRLRWAMARTGALHLTVLGGTAAAGWYGAALAWGVGLVAFSAFAVLRQILEHRAADADPAADYRSVAHGPTNRLFGAGPFARHFGSAGFNRHLLHHWDPAISYTRFDEMEAFLRRTPAAAQLDAAHDTYWSTFRRLLTRR